MKICLAMPNTGQATIGAGRSFWRASDKHDIAVAAANTCTAMLTFNSLWCWALQTEPDYFAMLHSDIEVGGEWWLDTLIDEMENNELDILSVVVPIKDHDGLTSTAYELDDKWNPCRLTMKEVHRLPETFTDERLLINTGCWVCKFDKAWAEQVTFTINDRIVCDDGKYTPQVEPEDWHFSRQARSLGLKLGATRKLYVVHKGSYDYPNDHPWGLLDFDERNTDKSLVPDEIPA